MSYIYSSPAFEFWAQHRLGVVIIAAALALILLAAGGLVLAHRRLHRAFRRLAMLADSSRDAVFNLNSDGKLKVWGLAANRLFGDRLRKGGDFCELVIAPESRLEVRGHIYEVLRGSIAEKEICQTFTSFDLNGKPFPIELTIKLAETKANQNQTALLAFVRDLRAEREQFVRDRLMSSVFTHAKEGISITDPSGRFLEVNTSFTTITGYSRDEILGCTPRILQSGRQTPEFYKELWSKLLTDGQWSGEIWNRRKSGEIYPEILSISAVRDVDGAVQHYVAVFTDISDIKKHQRELERVAHYDELTCLPNRTLLKCRLAQATVQAARHNRFVAAVHMDIDNFTAVNERYGQAFADELLRMLANRFQHALREDDCIARVGGDEFVALLCDIDSVQSAREVVGLLQKLITEPMRIEHVSICTTASMGVAIYPIDCDQPEQVLREAEQASYRAKQVGLSSLCYFDSAHQNAIRLRNQMTSELRMAFRDDQFLLYYQPKVEMRTGAVVGAEALIRWRHPTRGLIPPAEFLPIISQDEEFSVDLGEWVIETALRQLDQWQRQGIQVPLSVNIAGEHLQSKSFLPRLKAMLEQYQNLSPAMLELEILESSALADMACAQRVLEETTSLGVLSALDDFGTGYSSLSYLKHLPVGTLKIDQSFVRGMSSDDGDATIVRAVIELARAFNRGVIAEGVEDAGSMEALIALGCEYGQGYGIARPMHENAFVEWIQQRNTKPVWNHEPP